MTKYNSNYEIAQEISTRIGNSPIPFDSVYSICLKIYNELGGEPAEFDSVYEILLGILPLVEGGGSNVINDNIIALDKTWSSSKINEEIQAVGGTADSEFDGKTTEDFKFVTELPQEATEDEQVVIKGENVDTLYKYVSGAWVEQTPDATILYFDTENEALYSYVSAEQQFATISSVNTIVVGKNLNTSEALKAIKTPGTYSVLQRTSSTTKGEYTKKWTLTVEGIDYDEYELTDSIYQRLQSNYTIYKRTWSSVRTTNDGWTSFAVYYAGEIKDTKTSKYYTWSSNKLNDEFTLVDEKLDNIDAIINVDALPHAEINNRKIVRYNKHLWYSKPEEIKAVKFKALEDGSSVGLVALSSHQTLQYSIDGETWNTFDTTTNISLNNGESVFVRGILSDNNTQTDYTQFTISGKIVASGNINLLWNYEADDLGSAFELRLYCGYRLFYNCEGLVDVKELYLPSTGGAGDCYGYMFYGCINLTSAQEILPLDLSNSLACTYMYAKTKIETAPVLISPTISYQSVGYMFQPASQTVSPLKYIKCLATTISIGATKNWVRGVQTEGGTFVKASSMNDWTTGVDGIPQGWTVVNDDTVPEYTWHNAVIYNWYEMPLEAGTNIDITGNTISAKGYVFDEAKGSFATKYLNVNDSENIYIATNIASGDSSFAEGYETQATGNWGAHAEGYQTLASNSMGHAEGYGTKATGNYGAHAEGYLSEANEQVSHAEGRSIVNGRYGHGEGFKTVVNNYAEHAQGRENVSHTDVEGSQTYNNPKRTIHSIGIGTRDSNHLNAVEIMTNGDYYVRGIGDYDGVHIKYETGYENTKTLQEVVNGKQDTLTAGQNISIDASNNISAEGYVYNEANKTFHTVAKMTSSSLINKYTENGNKIGEGIAESGAFGSRNVIQTSTSHQEGETSSMNYTFGKGNTILGIKPSNVACGIGNTLYGGNTSAVFGVNNFLSENIDRANEVVVGLNLNATNTQEVALGLYNVSHTGANSNEKTNLSIGNGVYVSSGNKTIENLVETMKNGDIYVKGIGGYDGVHIKTETGYENTKTLQEYIASLEARIAALEGA